MIENHTHFSKRSLAHISGWTYFKFYSLLCFLWGIVNISLLAINIVFQFSKDILFPVYKILFFYKVFIGRRR